MPTHLLTAALAVLGVLTVMPGPDVAFMTRHALAARPADALRTVAGAATGTLLRGALTAAGLAAAPAASPAAHRALRAAGRRLLAVPGCADPPSDPPGRPLPPLADTGTRTGTGTGTGLAPALALALALATGRCPAVRGGPA
ncbi:hypothetical protein [Streptomyces pharetrae]|uniref:hypothetical protein n=1 Tax=Streptomyces pharetrae TaxID=291370 RepID=UPI0026CDDFD8